MEKFDPKDEQYKKVEDLPEKHKAKFSNVPEEFGVGFVQKEAMKSYEVYEEDAAERREELSFLGGDPNATAIDIAREDAEEDDDKHELARLDKQIEADGGKSDEELAQMVKESGVHGLAYVARKFLGKENSFRLRLGGELQTLSIAEMTIRKILSLHQEGKFYPELLDALSGVFLNEPEINSSAMKQAEEEAVEAKEDGIILDRGALAKDISFSGWSHGVCHLFEQYPAGISFLNSSENLSVAKKLVNEAIRRCINARAEGNISRIIDPIIAYNLAQLESGNLDDNFIFKPDSVHQDEFIQFLSDKLQKDRENGKSDDMTKMIKQKNIARVYFSRLETPRDFLKVLIKDGIEIPVSDERRRIELLHMIKDSITEEEMRIYLNKLYMVNNQEITLEELMQNLTEAEHATGEIVRGVFVDVEGTLIKDGRLNMSLVADLEREANSGKSVIVFTGGDKTAQTTNLRALGFPEKFLPVVAKSDYHGKILEHLIDDTIPEYQGFKAEYYQKPL